MLLIVVPNSSLQLQEEVIRALALKQKIEREAVVREAEKVKVKAEKVTDL